MTEKTEKFVKDSGSLRVSRTITFAWFWASFLPTLLHVSAFSTEAPSFEAFLATAKDALALAPGKGGDPRNTRFIARNFLIEERIDSGRATHYAAEIPLGGPASFDEWNVAHNLYLASHVFRPPSASYDPHHNAVDTGDTAVCPETFRSPLALTAFQGTDLDTDFIRVIPVSDIAWLSGRNEDEIFSLGQQVVMDPNPRSAPRADLAIILEEAFLGPKCDHRPVFAAFYEDFLELLRDPVDNTWPDRLRDRLGLYQLNQWTRPFPRRIFVFRYAVRDLPRRQGDADRRPIALPAVLDHRLAEAFFPAPRELRQGQIINFETGATDQPAREVLHLFMPMEPRHLFRVGTVTNPVPDDLGPARRDHLLWLRLLSGREEYATATDSDLF